MWKTKSVRKCMHKANKPPVCSHVEAGLIRTLIYLVVLCK